jgi:hypothetical protein
MALSSLNTPSLLHHLPGSGLDRETTPGFE